MIKSPLARLFSIISVSLFVGCIIGWFSYQIVLPFNTINTSIISHTPSSVNYSNLSDHDMEKELVRIDMEDIGNRIGLSSRQQKSYLEYLDTASIKYNIPMILIHSIICGESGYNPSAPHPRIKVNGKSTYALGLMGVVWEYNSVILIKKGIATSRLELTEPNVNISAGTYILSTNIKAIFSKNQNLSEDDFFDELVRKYYGAYDDKYKNSVLTKIKDIASRQWISRVVKNIRTKYKTTQVLADSSTNILNINKIESIFK